MSGTLIPTRPGDEAAAIEALAHDGSVALDSGGLILVGERLAAVPGALTAVAGLAATTGARSPGSRAAPVTAERSRPVPCPPCCPAAARSPTPPRASTSPPPGASSTCPRRRAATPTRSSPPRPPASSAAWWSAASTSTTSPTPSSLAQAVASGRLRGHPGAARHRGHPGRRRGLPGRTGHRRRPAPSSTGRAASARSARCCTTPPRCPTCGCWPASPRSSAAPLGFRTSEQVWAELDAGRPLGRRRAVDRTPVADDAVPADARREPPTRSSSPPGSS